MENNHKLPAFHNQVHEKGQDKDTSRLEWCMVGQSSAYISRLTLPVLPIGKRDHPCNINCVRVVHCSGQDVCSQLRLAKEEEAALRAQAAQQTGHLEAARVKHARSTSRLQEAQQASAVGGSYASLLMQVRNWLGLL